MNTRINEIPGEDGWWNSSGEETFQKIGKQLKAKGFTEDEAVEILTDLYYAVAGEFGS